MGEFYFSLPAHGVPATPVAPPPVAVAVHAREPGTVVVTVRNGGAVSLDGARQGHVVPYGSLELRGVSPGRHRVSVVGGEEQVVEVRPGVRAEVELVGEAPAVVSVPSSGSGGRAGIEWVRIPGGSFSMGSNDGDDDEKPVHTVRLSSFEMSRSEVTFGQYQACVDAGSCTAAHVSDGTCYVKQGGSWSEGTLLGSFQGRDQPVVCVDWEQARAFARWAGGRLPSEAEWEYAARGGQRYAYAGSSEVGAVAWYGENSGDRTHDVCGKERNGYGLCDMSGNVWEWLEDAWHGSYSGAPADGSAWTSGEDSNRVFRGGSWFNTAWSVRVAFRLRGGVPGRRNDYRGFRLAR